MNKDLKKINEKGLKWVEIAKALCVSKSTVSGWKSGRDEPSPQNKKLLKKLLDEMK